MIKNRILVFASSMHPLIVNEHKELQKHLDLVVLSGFLGPNALIRELFKNIFTLFFNIKYVLLFSKLIFSNLRNFRFHYLIYWYLHLLYILILDKKHGFDIIHAHWIYPAGLLATIYSRYIHKRVVITAHGYDADERTFKNVKLKELVIETGLLAETILTAEQRLYRNLRHHGLNNIFLTNNFVELTELEHDSTSRIKLKINPTAFVVIFGPHILEMYGVKDFVDAIVKMHQKIPNLFVICIGEGNMKGYVRQNFEEINIGYRITGKISHSDVITNLKACDVVCNNGYVSQGIFALEAFVCGKPVIGYDSIEEIKVEDGVTGLLSKIGDVNNLSELIIRLYEDPNLRKKLGTNARKKVETDFSKEKRIKDILTAYKVNI